MSIHLLYRSDGPLLFDDETKETIDFFGQIAKKMVEMEDGNMKMVDAGNKGDILRMKSMEEGERKRKEMNEE